MKKIILIIALFSAFQSVWAQQQTLNSQYMFNRFLINPAVTGNQEYIPIRLTARQQWIGVEEAPSTQSISAHMLLGNKNMGVGGYIFADRFGPETKVGIQASYSYILDINSRKGLKLAFGLAARAFQYKLNYNQLEVMDQDDNLLYQNSESTFVPDADFGVYLYNKKYFVGLSATQLIGMPVEITHTSIRENDMVRHYYLLGGYKFDIADDFQLEPSTIIRATEVTPFSADVNLRAIYQSNYWLGVSYRSSNTIAAMIGAKYKDFVFGYSYDYTLSKMNNHQSGSHEIILGYNFGQKLNKGSSLL